MRMTDLFARRGPRCLVVVLAVAVATLSASGGAPGTVWVVNRDAGDLTIFDAETGKPLKTLPVGAGAHDVCISERAGKAYIAAETINAVTTVDLKTLQIESIPVGPLPHHVESSPDGSKIYVSLASHTTTVGVPEVAVIDTADNSVTYIKTSNSPLARSHGPRPSLDGETLYVAHDTGNEVTGVQLESGNIAPLAGPISRAEEVIPTRFGHSLWVASRGDGTVKRIDLDTNAITASIPVGVQPESVMLTPSERILIVSLRGTPAAVAFVDTVKQAVVKMTEIAGAGSFGDLAVMSDDGRFVYATFDTGVTGIGGVAVLDTGSGGVASTWTYPTTGRPHGVWYSKSKLKIQ